MKSTDLPIVVSRTCKTTTEEAWQALTQLDHMKQWYFDNIPDFKPLVGFKTQFPVSSGERTFTHLWEVVKTVPLKKIRYHWRYEEYPGDCLVTFEIEKEDNNVKVTVATEVVKDFPSNITEFERESGVAGWNYFMERLKTYLES